jgi:hypothetical protein
VSKGGDLDDVLFVFFSLRKKLIRLRPRRGASGHLVEPRDFSVRDMLLSYWLLGLV